MNYLRPQLLDKLVEAYVLGTMSRRAGRRFQSILEANDVAQNRVLVLEEALLPLSWSVAPMKPSDLVWQKIAREIYGSSDQVRQRWVPWAAAVATLAIGLAITSVGWWQTSQRPPEEIVTTIPVPEPATVAVVGEQNQQPIWIARFYTQSQRLDIRVNTEPSSEANKDYQLWSLMDDGTPVSLGLLPKTGQTSITLAKNQLDALGQSKLVAVSLEPLGGSPKPVPTGPVLFTAALLSP